MTARWRRSPEVVTRRIAGETILVPVRGRLADMERLYLLNETGAAIWEQLDGTAEITDLAARIAGEYEVSLAEALADAERLVTELSDGGLVEPCGDAPCPPA